MKIWFPELALTCNSGGVFSIRSGSFKLGVDSPFKSFTFRESEHLGEDLVSGTIVVSISIVTYATGCLNMYPVRTAVLLLL